MLLGFAKRIAVLTALAEGAYQAAYGASVRIGRAGEFPPYAHQAVDGLFDLVESAVLVGRLDSARTHVDAAERLRLGENSPRLDALIIAVRAMTAPDAEAGALYESALAHLAEFRQFAVSRYSVLSRSYVIEAAIDGSRERDGVFRSMG